MPQRANKPQGRVNELRLLFDKAEVGHTIRLHLAEGGTSSEPIPFEPFLTEEDYNDLRWYLEEYMDLPDGGSVVRAERIERSLAEWGRRLYGAVFDPGDNREIFNAFTDGPGPRLLTIATKDVDLLRLPWEMTADSVGPLSQQGITIRRQLETAKKSIEYRVTLPLRILLIVSRPDDLGFIDPRHTTRGMLDALEGLGRNVAVDFCRPPTLARMEEMLAAANRRNEPYHIIHFDGHGTFLPEIGLGALCFERAMPDGAGGEVKTDFVRADRLGDLLAKHKIPMAVLEACRSGQIDRVAAFRSVAPRLIDAGVGSVLSMSHAVHIEATRILLERFYRELVSGLTIGQSLEEGRAALIAHPYRWLEHGPQARSIPLKDWFLPNLYQRGTDLRLVPESEAVEGPALPAQIVEPDREIRFDLFLSHNHADSERVEQIAEQLKDRFNLRVFLDKWHIKTGPIHEQCEEAIQHSRFVLIVCSKEAMESDWVRAERDMAHAIDPRGRNIIPILLETVNLPPGLAALRSYDLRNPAQDARTLAELTDAVKSAPLIGEAGPSAAPSPVAAGRRRMPVEGEEPGAFPRPPIYRFHGRARELYLLQREFHSFRAILLHAMGGMGKTALAREAAFWWTRTGLFPDGACFVSFERGGGADWIALTLGTYLEGPEFERLGSDEQSARAKALFQSKKVLMVWDNFESVLPAFQSDEPAPVVTDDEQSRIQELFQDWTEPPAGHGRLLITCRPAEAGLTGARRKELHGLARPDALSLLVRVMKIHDVELTDERLTKEGLDELLKVLANHPLSIELVGPHLKEMTPEEIVADFEKLLAEFKTGEGKERNESLLASLAFSTRRLSPQAQSALPWLGLFSGGVFEEILLSVSEVDPEVWESVRGELEATALVRVEREILLADRPYLRFHPTLSYAARIPHTGHLPEEEGEEGVSNLDSDDVRKRFIGVYRAVAKGIHKALRGSNPRTGMEVMAREEVNIRAAVRLALESRAYTEASAMGHTFRDYLERCARFRERDSWIKWLAGEVGKVGFTQEAATYEEQEAWSLFTQGHAKEAKEKLVSLIERLKKTSEFDSVFPLASTQVTLGRLYYQTGMFEQAISNLEDAIKKWEALIEREKSEKRSSENERGNLAATLSDLANAFRLVGRLGEAMKAAEKAISIFKELRRKGMVTYILIQIAQICTEQGRYEEANNRFAEAIEMARSAGNKELEGKTLQNQGVLALNMGQYDRATYLSKQALKLFQDANDEKSIMLTCNNLGTVDYKQGRLSEAREWFERSHEIAERRNDKDSLGDAAQNIGIVCQLEGEAALEAGDEARAKEQFREAVRFVKISLNLAIENSKKPSEAGSYGQLAQIHLFLGDLDKAEEHAQRAREILEDLGLKEAHMVYHDLSRIARARGNQSEAAEWERKGNEALAELESRAQGAGGPPQQLLKAIQALAMECARAGVDRTDLSPQAEAALAQLDQAPPPLNALAPFLRELATGKIPSIPPALPDELGRMLSEIVDAVKEAKGGG